MSWLMKLKLRLARKWLMQVGLTPARIEERAGTQYILDGEGVWHKIGRR